MRNSLFLCYLALILICGSACAADELVVLPEPTILGNSPDNGYPLLQKVDSDREKVYPEQILIDVDKGIVAAVRAIYGSSVEFDDIEKAIDRMYGEWSRQGFESTGIRLWRVEPMRFAVHLSIDDDGMAQVILLPFKELKSKQKIRN